MGFLGKRNARVLRSGQPAETSGTVCDPVNRETHNPGPTVSSGHVEVRERGCCPQGHEVSCLKPSGEGTGWGRDSQEFPTSAPSPPRQRGTGRSTSFGSVFSFLGHEDPLGLQTWTLQISQKCLQRPKVFRQQLVREPPRRQKAGAVSESMKLLDQAIPETNATEVCIA